MQTDNVLVSVIVPVYKAEAYLDRSVESILNQTYPNLEIILVDDGSPDNSGSMCDAFAERDSRIKVIHKSNGGASSARNAALETASGDYIGFADADDWLEPDMYERLLNNIAGTGADISVCGVRLCSEEGKTTFWNDDLELTKVFTREEALTELIEEKLLTFGLWNKLIKREVIGTQRFVEGIIYEDNEFLPKCIAKAEKVIFSGQAGYNHFLSPVSVMRGDYSLKHYDLITVSRENIRFYEKECPSALNLMKSRYLVSVLDAIYKSSGNPDWNGKRDELIQEIKNPVSEEVLKYLDRKNRVKLSLCRISPELYSKIMKFYRVRFVGEL